MHSKDSRAPNTSGSRSRAQSEGSLLSTRKVSHAQLSAISPKCKEFDTEAASKLRLPKQHLPTDKDRGASYRGMKENSKHIPNKIEQNCNNQKSSLNDLRWRGGRWPQRTWTNTREKVARIARICMPKHFKRRSNVNPENLSHELRRNARRVEKETQPERPAHAEERA